MTNLILSNFMVSKTINKCYIISVTNAEHNGRRTPQISIDKFKRSGIDTKRRGGGKSIGFTNATM